MKGLRLALKISSSSACQLQFACIHKTLFMIISAMRDNIRREIEREEAELET